MSEVNLARSNPKALGCLGRMAGAAQQLPQLHPDPADRVLAATAQVLGLALVTADGQLLGLGEITTLANR